MREFERVQVETRSEWRYWLQINHAQPDSVWLVTFKKNSGQPHLTASDAIEEALCFGWIDSLPRKLDDLRTMLLMSPRRPGSGWSAINKRRVEKLIRAGLMAPAGLQKVEAAKVDGSWNALDDVERMVVPDDLGAALRDNPVAERCFAAFPPSTRRGILQWIASARTPATRNKRIAETVRLAAENVRANTPAARQPRRPQRPS